MVTPDLVPDLVPADLVPAGGRHADLTPGAVLRAAVAVMDRAWCWGQADCCTAACDVFAGLHGVDPMARLRGGYWSRGGARRVIRGMGGFLAMADTLASEARLRPGPEVPGAIGVVRIPGVDGEAGLALAVCICPGRWAGKSAEGLVTVTDQLRCWHA